VSAAASLQLKRPRHLLQLQRKVFWQFLHRGTAAVRADNRQSRRQSVRCCDFRPPTADSSCLVSTARRDLQLQRLHTRTLRLTVSGPT